MNLRHAAELRRQGTQAPADRPAQRRCAELRDAPAYVRAAVPAGFTVRQPGEAGGSIEFRGVASVTEAPYEMHDMFGPYMEVVSAAAFDDTLRVEGLDVPLVIAHDQTRRIARTLNGTLQLSAGPDGLDVSAQLDPADLDVQYIAPKLASGLIDEMSFAFRVTSGLWSPDYSEYRIQSVDIHRGDVAIVGYGANPATSAGTRSARKLSDDELRAEMERRGLAAPTRSPRRLSRDAALLLLTD